MHIYIGSDHGGVTQKAVLTDSLTAQGHQVTDCGAYSSESTDYPDFALAVGRSVQGEPGSYGVLLCRSGEGMEMAANKLSGIRAALVWRPDVAHETRRDNDANILVLPSDFISDDEAVAIASTFFSTDFSGEDRHVRRIEKMHAIERARHEK